MKLKRSDENLPEKNGNKKYGVGIKESNKQAGFFVSLLDFVVFSSLGFPDKKA